MKGRWGRGKDGTPGRTWQRGDRVKLTLFQGVPAWFNIQCNSSPVSLHGRTYTVSFGPALDCEGASSPSGRHRRPRRQLRPASPPGPQLRRPLPLARRQPAQPAGQSRSPVVQVLGLRLRRRRLQLHHASRRTSSSARPSNCSPNAPAFDFTRRSDASASRAASTRADATQRKAHALSTCWPGPRTNSTAASCRRPEAEPGRAYLAERGITHESASASFTSASHRTAGTGCSNAPAAPNGRPPFSSASASSAAKNSAAASTTGSAAA